MLRSYLTIALRNIKRHKLFSFINIFGLALSISVCLSVIMIIIGQLDYDKFHPNTDRIFRIVSNITFQENQEEQYATSPMPLASKLLDDYTFVEHVVRIYPAIYNEASDGQKKITVEGAFVDSTFFKIFGFKLEAGNPETALSKPNCIVLSKETAVKFFGQQDPIGQILFIKDLGDFTITGVLQKSPLKSHLDYELLASMASVLSLEKNKKLEGVSNLWDRYQACYTYIKLKADVNHEVLEGTLSSISKQVLKTFNFKNNEISYQFEKQSIKSITPTKELILDNSKGISLQMILIISAIVFVILLLACFNYTNLSIARSLMRAKEVGIRKVVGAVRHQIFTQFLVESILISFLALILAFIFLPFLPLSTTFKQGISYSLNIEIVLWFLLFSLFAGALAGVLPAWVLSSMKPVQVLKDLSGLKLFKALTLRKILIIFQFAISLIFIIGLLTVFRQTRYMVTAEYGFNPKGIINIPLYSNNREVLIEQISRNNDVVRVSSTSTNLGYFPTGYCKGQVEKGANKIDLAYYFVDQNFVPNMELEILSGKNIPDNISSKYEQFVLLNEKGVDAFKLGTPIDAVGKSLWLDDTTQVQVVGIIKDFHFQNFKRPITPMVLRYKPDQLAFLNIKMRSNNVKSNIAYLEEVWKKLDIKYPFEFELFEKEFYERQSKVQDVSIIGFLAIISLTIACLGLLGMATYMAETRSREIGIRKVLGASVTNIMLLLSKDFIFLLLIAGCIALPIGYWIGREYLNDFTYQVSLGIGTLIVGFLLMLMLGLLTFCSQTLRSAKNNPLKVLRNE